MYALELREMKQRVRNAAKYKGFSRHYIMFENFYNKSGFAGILKSASSIYSNKYKK